MILIEILESNMKALLREKDIIPTTKRDTTFNISPMEAIIGEETLSGSRPLLKETIATRIVVKIRPTAAKIEANSEIKKRCINPIV